MSEREIRNIVRSVCADLDERARRAARTRIQKVVVPAALGVTLAVSSCASEEDTPLYAAPLPDSGQIQTEASVESGPGAEAGEPDPGPVMEYDAPLPDAAVQPVYMAVVDASADGATSRDAQTTTDADQASDASQVDVGPVLEYMAIIPDAGVVPPYQAIIPDAGVVPPPQDAGPQILYMAAVVVDAGNENPDPTPVPIYAASTPEE